MAGLVGLMAAVVPTPINLGRVTEWVMRHEPQKAAVPSWSMCATWASTVVMIGLVAAALSPRMTLWGLTELKMELLVQLAPAFFLGLRWRALRGGAGRFWPAGVHAGLIGLAANVARCAVGSIRPVRRDRSSSFAALS